MTTQEIRLDLPSAPEFVRLARLAAADVAARVGFGYEEIDDLKIAVDELCHVISAGAPDQRLALTFSWSENGLRVEGSCASNAEPTPSALASALLAVVVDSFEITARSGVAGFTFAKGSAALGSVEAR